MTMEQEIDELRCKLDISEQRRTNVERTLTAAGHAVGILKSYQPDLDVSRVTRGYKCS
jgi:hypothetical protein